MGQFEDRPAELPKELHSSTPLPGVDSIEVSSRRPDGGTDALLFAKDLAVACPAPFIFKQPVVLRKGAVLSATIYIIPKVPPPAAYRLTVSRVST